MHSDFSLRCFKADVVATLGYFWGKNEVHLINNLHSASIKPKSPEILKIFFPISLFVFKLIK